MKRASSKSAASSLVCMICESSCPKERLPFQACRSANLNREGNHVPSESAIVLKLVDLALFLPNNHPIVRSVVNSAVAFLSLRAALIAGQPRNACAALLRISNDPPSTAATAFPFIRPSALPHYLEFATGGGKSGTANLGTGNVTRAGTFA